MITYYEKLLPTQEYFSDLNENPAEYLGQIFNFCSLFSAGYSAENIELSVPKSGSMQQLSTPPIQLAFVCGLVKFISAKSVLEIGTFIGHSSIRMAQTIGSKGRVTTIEVGKEFAEIAKENFERHGCSDQIELINGDASSVLKKLNSKAFDFIYIDGSKENYLAYALESERLVSNKGLIVVDDVFFHGDALSNTPKTEKGKGCRELLDYYSNNDSCSAMLLPIFNGVLILFDFNGVSS